jgi:hypothetical protein
MSHEHSIVKSIEHQLNVLLLGALCFVVIMEKALNSFGCHMDLTEP